MVTTLRLGRVGGLRVTVAVTRSLDQSPHDVYLIDLDLALPDDGGPGGARFDEVPWLADLEPVLAASDALPEWVVDVTRSHRSDGGGGRAQIAVLLARGSDPAAPWPEPDLTGPVRAAFTRMVAHAAPSAPVVALPHGAALAAARAAVAELFRDVDSGLLSLTDEEHHAAEGSWSLGWALPGVARFRVQVGLVRASPTSVHVRRMPVAEVVDSVGT
ncbi:hypothetical protein [Nostocoides sp. HKS02]|uniref:hypothetical protein n=1 Tax=Nostocoides sp. HKS02 TaxID=1813880 RepID=UPI0012B4A2B6|nr:hypothetical protein [Tetrasphaera sp. HKS02]QGN57472.1 hypothetical protein GKE56_05840 [Tetrasphaera sp. HKS02]